jgi:hypothetical protein
MSAKGQTAAMKAQSGGGSDAGRRAYWNSVVTSTLMRHASLHGIVDPGAHQWSQLPKPVADAMAPLAQSLVEAACKDEADSPGHRHAEEQRINIALWNALKRFRTDKVPPLRDEQTALHFQD